MPMSSAYLRTRRSLPRESAFIFDKNGLKPAPPLQSQSVMNPGAPIVEIRRRCPSLEI
jgi:hypothetical protein